MESAKAKATCPEEEDRLPLSRILTDALQRRVPEDVEDWTNLPTTRGNEMDFTVRETPAKADDHLTASEAERQRLPLGEPRAPPATRAGIC